MQFDLFSFLLTYWWIVLILVFIIILLLIVPFIRVLREYERAVIFRLGRAIPGVKGPGVIFLVPILDKWVKVDLREQFFEIEHQRCITSDNAPVDIDLLIYHRVVNARDSVLRIRDFSGAALGISQTTLRAVVGDITLDDVLAKREYINSVLREKLDENTEPWGVKVTKVEIREILPPTKVNEAMIMQMEAERRRRAMVTEAAGKREATIAVAEGDKRSAVLKAEGDKEAAILRAEGEALALQKVFDTAKGIDEKTMALQYLHTIQALGASPSTKYVIPIEFTQLVTPIQKFLKDIK
ncbi:MAG: SPFH domain-containing protein [Candidatus Thorarchaeota archaeon]